MSADIGNLGWWAGSSDTILKGDHPRTIPPKFGPNWPSSFRRFLVTAAILVGGKGRRTNSERGQGDHQRTIPAKFGADWHSGFRED